MQGSPRYLMSGGFLLVRMVVLVVMLLSVRPAG